MPAVKSTADIAEKWATVTPQRAGEYEKGVRNPRKSWAEGATNANAAYKEGIQKSLQADSFVKGVKKAGDQKWARGAIEKGTSRFGPGVQVARADYEKGFAPYRDIIEKTVLPPRFARRDPRNIERVSAMVKALVAEKTKQMGG